MSIITFWNDGKVETGQTMSMAAIATYIAIEENYKILMINTKKDDATIEDGYWNQLKNSRVVNLQSKADIATGTSGLIKAVASNKTSPEIITNYTKTIFKNRLELLTDNNIVDYEKQRSLMKDIIKMANKYYDLVFVDLEGDVEDRIVGGILEETNLIVLNITQRLRNLNEYIKIKKTNNIMKKDNVLGIIGKYDKYSIYNIKNIERLIKTKDLYSIPYNTLYFEATNEGKVADYFIKFRNYKRNDANAEFMAYIEQVSTEIIKKLKKIQMQNY